MLKLLVCAYLLPSILVHLIVSVKSELFLVQLDITVMIFDHGSKILILT
jgi:hypothetical protein